MSNYLEALEWRYATKRMNGKQVPAEKLDNILESIRLAPTSYGLQPFEVLVIESPEWKAKLAPAAYNQPQITESSAVLIFAAKTSITEASIQQYIEQIAAERNLPLEALNDFKQMMLGTAKNLDAAAQTIWAQKQAYIGLGFALAAAALEKVDSVPMEGFNPAAVDEILQLTEQGLTATVILPLGYRDEQNDYLVNAKKVRKPKHQMIRFLDSEAN